jgi:hypothetical protein
MAALYSLAALPFEDKIMTKLHIVDIALYALVKPGIVKFRVIELIAVLGRW